MDLIVDSREPENIQTLFKGIKGYDVKIQELKYGDIQYGDLVIERKTNQDFLSSWYSGHLHVQICEMLQNTKHPLLVVHKSETEYRLNRVDYAKIQQHTESLNISIPTFKFGSTESMIEFVTRQLKNYEDGKYFEYFKRPVQVESNINPIIAMYCSIPDIGQKVAEELYKKYPTPHSLIDAITFSDNWDTDIKLLGKKRKESIVKIMMEGIE